jgi:hypothetical protein
VWLRLTGVLVALCLGAPAYAQPLSIAASNSNNQTGANNNLIYGVTPTLQAVGPPALSLGVLPINPAYPTTPAYYGFNTLAYAPSVQSGATVDLIGAGFASDYCCGSIYRFFGPTFSGTLGAAAPNAVSVWSCPAPYNPQLFGYAGPVCAGPQYPLSMAVDGLGTLYVLSQDYVIACQEPESPTPIAVELWAFPVSASSASGFVANPVLVDPNVAGYGQSWNGDTAVCVSSPRNYAANNIDVANGLLGAGVIENPSAGNTYALPQVDLMTAPAGVAPPASANDVLVLFGDSTCAGCAPGVPEIPVAVLADYSASNLQAVLSATGTNPPWSVLATPLTVANSIDFANWGNWLFQPAAAGVPCCVAVSSAPSGEGASSIAAWPANSHPMVMTSLGNIRPFTWSASTGTPTTYTVVPDPPFSAGGLPAGCNAPSPSTITGAGGVVPSPLTSQVVTLRTGADAGNSYAFVTQYTCSEGPGTPSQVVSLNGINTPQTVSESDGPLAGLATSAATGPGTVPAHNGTGTGTECLTGCNITGGDTQTLTGTAAAIAAVEALGAAGTIAENICTVVTDPRQICPPGIPGNPYYYSRTLPVAAVCPSLPAGGAGNSLIPDYLCGGYGPRGAGSGTGFAVIQGIADKINAIPGLLNLNDVNPDSFFPPGGTSECSPIGIFVDNISDGWGPWSLSKTEGVIPEGDRLIELTDGCGGDKEPTSGMSLTVSGLKLVVDNATQELGPLPKNLANFAEYKYLNLDLELAQDPIDFPNKLRILEIITQSALFLAAGKHACAEDTLYEADRYVIKNASHFHGVPAQDPNSYGRTRARILNLFYTLFTRLDGNVNPITGNSLYVNLPLLAPSLSGPPVTCSVSYLGSDGY